MFVKRYLLISTFSWFSLGIKNHRLESLLLVWSYRCLGLFLGPVVYNWKEARPFIRDQLFEILTLNCCLLSVAGRLLVGCLFVCCRLLVVVAVLHNSQSNCRLRLHSGLGA